jgi:hypothetical protein
MLDAIRPPIETERCLMERFPLDTQFLRQSWQVDRLLGPATDPSTLTEPPLFTNLQHLWREERLPGTGRQNRPRRQDWSQT